MSFLNGSVTTDTSAQPFARTSETALPDWYTDYAMKIIANQGQVSGTPYTTFQGPRVAGFNPDQQRAFELTRQVARPTGLQTIEGQLDNISNRSSVGAASPYLDRAAGMSGVDAATPGLNTGQGYLAQSTDPTGISLATPYLASSAATSASRVGEYMDPYQDAVVDHYGDLAARQVSEKLLPSLTDRFVRAGQFGGTAGEAPSRFGMELGRGIRDIQEDTGGRQAQLMSEGYKSALGASATDLARLGQLGATAGSLGTDQQRILQGAGAGTADIGKAFGSLTADQQRILSGIGGTTGQLYGQDTQAMLQAAQQQAALEQQRQQMGITGADALNRVGTQQQGNTQANYDTAFADFMRQQGYDQTQIDAAVKTLGGVKGAVPTATLETGYGSTSETSINPSTLQQIAGVLGTLGKVF